jgi:hypothetical protein
MAFVARLLFNFIAKAGVTLHKPMRLVTTMGFRYVLPIEIFAPAPVVVLVVVVAVVPRPA